MVDFKKKLAEQRLQERMAKLAKDKPVSMIPQPRQPKAVEPPPPDLRELNVSLVDKSTLGRLIPQHVAWGLQEKEAKKIKKSLSERIKEVLIRFPITKFMCGGNKVNFYCTPHIEISKELLLAHGVSPETINACTITKDKWNLRISPAGKEETNGEEE